MFFLPLYTVNGGGGALKPGLYVVYFSFFFF